MRAINLPTNVLRDLRDFRVQRRTQILTCHGETTNGYRQSVEANRIENGTEVRASCCLSDHSRIKIIVIVRSWVVQTQGKGHRLKTIVATHTRSTFGMELVFG